MIKIFHNFFNKLKVMMMEKFHCGNIFQLLKIKKWLFSSLAFDWNFSGFQFINMMTLNMKNAFQFILNVKIHGFFISIIILLFESNDIVFDNQVNVINKIKLNARWRCFGYKPADVAWLHTLERPQMLPHPKWIAP